MTSLTRAAPAHPEHPIYPHTFGGWPPCAKCFRRRDLAWTIPGPIRICRDCAVASAASRPVDLPAAEELTEVWQTLARLHHNREIGDDTLDAAIATLRPDLPLPEGRRAVLLLTDALLHLQAADAPSTVLGVEVPGHDVETYVNHWRGIAGDALAELTGGRR